MFAASSSTTATAPLSPKSKPCPSPREAPMPPPKSPANLPRRLSRQLRHGHVQPPIFQHLRPAAKSADNAYAAVIAAFAKALLNGKRPSIYGDGEQSRDFTFVDDAVHANLLAAQRAEPIGGVVINIACGAYITVNDLARQMSHWLGRTELTPVYSPEHGDVKHSLADLSRAVKILGYQPIVDFTRGLEVHHGLVQGCLHRPPPRCCVLTPHVDAARFRC